MTAAAPSAAAPAAAADEPRLKLSLIAGYGVSELGKGVFIASLQLVWLYYLTDVVGIPPATAGLIMLAPLVWDGIVDPFIGFLADRTRTPWGKYRPYLLFGAPIASLLMVAVFFRPSLSEQGAILFALAGAVLFRTAYAFIDVPHNALLAATTRKSRERATLAGAKMVFGGIAGTAVSIAIMPILQGASPGEEASRFFIAAAAGGVLATAAIYVCVYTFRDIDNARTAAAGDGHRIELRDFAAVLKGNVPLYIVFGVWVAAILTVPTFSKSLLYFAKYDLKDPAWGGFALTVMHVGQFGSIPLWAWLAHKLPKARLVQVAFGLSIVVLGVLLVADVRDTTALNVLVFLEGASIGGSFGVAMAMVPDLVEYGEWKTGRRVEAGVFGFHTFAVKVGNGIGVGLFGILLGQVGFVANTEQTPETLHGLRVLMTAMPMAGGVAAILALFFYPLDHETHARMTAEIAARRGEAA